MKDIQDNISHAIELASINTAIRAEAYASALREIKELPIKNETEGNLLQQLVVEILKKIAEEAKGNTDPAKNLAKELINNFVDELVKDSDK